MKQGLVFVFFICMSANVFSQDREAEFLRIAVDFTEESKHLEAIKVCDKLTKLLPENEDVYYLRGINKYMLNRIVRVFGGDPNKRQIEEYAETV